MFSKKVALLIAFLAVFFLAALSPAEEEKPAEAEREIFSSGAKSPGTTELNVEEKLKQPITLDFTNTPFGDVIDFLRTVGDINMVIDRSVITEADLSSPVILRLEKVPIGYALEIVLRQMQLDSKITDEGIFISKGFQLHTEIFEIKYARPEEILQIAEHFLSKGARIHTGPYDTLTVKGTGADIEAVGNFINRFDVPQPTLQFKFQLIRASKNEGKAEMPEELAPIAEELKGPFKYDRFEAAAAGFLTTFADGRPKHLLLETEKEAPPYSINFMPSFLPEGEGVIKVHDLHILKTARGGPEVLETYSEVRTTLQIKPGETVIVGGLCTSDSARIFIITAWVKEAEVPFALDQSTPEGAWKLFQKAVKDGNFKAAWEYFSPEYKARHGSYEKWFEAMSPHDIEYLVEYRVVRVQPVGEERAFITVERPGAATNHFRMKKIGDKWYIERWQ